MVLLKQLGIQICDSCGDAHTPLKPERPPENPREMHGFWARQEIMKKSKCGCWGETPRSRKHKWTPKDEMQSRVRRQVEKKNNNKPFSLASLFKESNHIGGFMQMNNSLRLEHALKEDDAPKPNNIIDTLNECYLHYHKMSTERPDHPYVLEWKRRMRNIMEAKQCVRVMMRVKSEINKHLGEFGNE